MSSQEDLDAWEGMGPREAMEAQQDLDAQEEADIQAALELSRIDMEERADPDEVDALPTYSSAPGPEDILLRHLLDSAAGDAPQTSGHDNNNSLPPSYENLTLDDYTAARHRLVESWQTWCHMKRDEYTQDFVIWQESKNMQAYGEHQRWKSEVERYKRELEEERQGYYLERAKQLEARFRARLPKEEMLPWDMERDFQIQEPVKPERRRSEAIVREDIS